MGFQLKLLFFFWAFLLSSLTFCHSQNVTVKIVGTINCTGCIKQEQLSISQEYSGLHVTVHCYYKNRETKTHGTGSVDGQGNFNITLMEDKNSIHICYATLQSSLTTQCPIHKARTASMKILSFHHNETQTLLHNIHSPVKFYPETCQSAFFWPFFKFPPKPEFMLPSPLPPITCWPSSPPVQFPFPPPPPPALSIPNVPLSPSLPPTLAPPGPESGNPFPPPPPPGLRIPNLPPSPSLPPTLPPAGPESGNPFPPPQMPEFPPPPIPKFQKPMLPPFPKQPFYQTPNVPSQSPLSPPIPAPTKKAHHYSQSAPPIPTVASPTPFPTPSEKASPPPVPQPGKQIPPPSPTGILTPTPIYRDPNPIPRPPPVPQLPPMAAVPRKYFNPPKPQPQPPVSSHNSRS